MANNAVLSTAKVNQFRFLPNPLDSALISKKVKVNAPRVTDAVLCTVKMTQDSIQKANAMCPVKFAITTKEVDAH